MKKTLLTIAAIMCGAMTTNAIEDNTVEVVYNGSSATVTVADNIKSYVTSTVKDANVSIVQSASVNDKTGEILYYLSGSSDDGAFYMEGSYKATIVLNGLTLTSKSGAPINIQNGKRIKFSLATSTTNTLADAANGDWKGCLVCKGHSEFRGKGTLNVTGNTAHGIWSKEYVEIKNCTINVLLSAKDALNCNQYFFMESGTLNITNPGDDAIQVSLEGNVNTGTTTSHEDEDSGNFYQTGGTISIGTVSNGYCIKTQGTITYSGGTQDFDKANVLENATTGINSSMADQNEEVEVYDLNGRRLSNEASTKKGVYILKKGSTTQKILK